MTAYPADCQMPPNSACGLCSVKLYTSIVVLSLPPGQSGSPGVVDEMGQCCIFKVNDSSFDTTGFSDSSSISTFGILAIEIINKLAETQKVTITNT